MNTFIWVSNGKVGLFVTNSKAWKILKRAEEDLDMLLVERISGGKDGGGSKLTQEGEELLEKYEKFIHNWKWI